MTGQCKRQSDFRKCTGNESLAGRHKEDDDPKTAWVEGAKGSGAGEWIRFHVTPMQGATAVRLRLRNGYQKSKRLFRANARLEEVTVRLQPGGHTQKFSLTDTWGWGFVLAGQFSKAVPILESAAKLSPETPTIYYHLAKAYYGIKEHSRARLAVQRAMKMGIPFKDQDAALALFNELNGR